MFWWIIYSSSFVFLEVFFSGIVTIDYAFPLFWHVLVYYFLTVLVVCNIDWCHDGGDIRCLLQYYLLPVRLSQFFDGYGYHGTSFEQTYRCYPASFIEKVSIPFRHLLLILCNNIEFGKVYWWLIPILIGHWVWCSLPLWHCQMYCFWWTKIRHELCSYFLFLQFFRYSFQCISCAIDSILY